MKQAVIYCRVSTEKQQQSKNIQTQIQVVHEYAARNGFNVTDEFLDDGISGTLPLEERPAGKRLIEAARRGQISTLIIYKVDRLGRSQIVTMTALRDLNELGVDICSATETLDLTTPMGRAMTGIQSVFGQLERDTFLERSRTATLRLAAEGAWLGGIVPYGYRVTGKKREAKLLVSDEPIPGHTLSEAGVIRSIYNWAEEGRSCYFIADQLNALGIPPSYTRDERKVNKTDLLHGKRKERTQSVWRPSRICNMLREPIYKGVHLYGRRSNSGRAPIERSMPAIVSVEQWDKAQATLTKNMLFSKRSAKRKYLLRGLIKCDLCGLTYIGTVSAVYQKKSEAQEEKKVRAYYVCNGKQNARGIYADRGQKCPSKSIQGDVEEIVWKDIENFLRNPGAVLQQIEQRLGEEEQDQGQLSAQIESSKYALKEKQESRLRAATLLVEGRFDDATYDALCLNLDAEEKTLRDYIREVEAQLRQTGHSAARLSTTEDWLKNFNLWLDEELSWEIKREIVEALVEKIMVETVEIAGKKTARAVVYYAFDKSDISVNIVPTTSDMDVPAVSCWGERPPARPPKSPAPAPRLKSGATSRASAAHCWIASTFTSKCPDCHRKN